MKFEDTDYWKAIVLYGLNAASYKIALGHVLLDFAAHGKSSIDWHSLSEAFFEEYWKRLEIGKPMPQQSVTGRLTVMERIILASPRWVVRVEC